MKLFWYTFIGVCLSLPNAGAQSSKLYEDQQVSSIYLELPPDSFQLILSQLINDRYLRARMIFDDGEQRDTVEEVGLRLRGNTSLGAAKKSFKISINAFAPGREYQGVRKINLRGQHNDPTMVREKLFYEVWKDAGLKERRASFVKLYINQQYRGLYTNIEELDKQWLDRHYSDNDGNLFKCTWPADLVYLGADQSIYKAIMNNPEERAYELQTNEAEDDYSRLVALITALNKPVDASFAQEISQILDVSSVLKAFAVDVASGNWDDYFYNKNNYYLYDDPSSGRFEFITYDTDNTFGVDWLGKDWAKRNLSAWLPNEPRPLATKLLAVPAFRQEYLRYLDTLSRFLVHPDTIFPRIDALEALITPAAEADPFRTLDYGYTIADFHNGFDQTIDNHTPYGIKPFLATRYEYTRNQLAGVLPANEAVFPEISVRLYPNPASEFLRLEWDDQEINGDHLVEIYGNTGSLMARFILPGTTRSYNIRLESYPAGFYYLKLHAAIGVTWWPFQKWE
ncbi:MAG: CotH kinase family protein [Saprospiraceae bacterium]|nr:CotH kinase family protein [Saprospiraceae bacterium]